MTEDEARRWLSERFSTEEIERLAALAELVVAENQRQNLIAKSSEEQIWSRHIVDSAQLLAFDVAGDWLDIGTGAGFPGLVVACLRRDPVVLCEPRGRRADFLQRSVERLELHNCHVAACRSNNLTDRQFAIVSARAVAPPLTLIDSVSRVTSLATRFLLHRGAQSSDDAIALKLGGLTGVFHVKQSVTHPDSNILVATDVVRP